jgi:biopolymer transport protein ExbD
VRFRQTGRRKGAIINVTSLIDVLFLLVIFVLVSARFEETAGVEVALPGGRARAETETKTLTLTLSAEGKAYLQTEAVPMDALAERLSAIARKNPKTVLKVRADKRLSWEAVHTALDIAKAAGLRRVSLVSRR